MIVYVLIWKSMTGVCVLFKWLLAFCCCTHFCTMKNGIFVPIIWKKGKLMHPQLFLCFINCSYMSTFGQKFPSCFSFDSFTSSLDFLIIAGICNLQLAFAVHMLQVIVKYLSWYKLVTNSSSAKHENNPFL